VIEQLSMFPPPPGRGPTRPPQTRIVTKARLHKVFFALRPSAHEAMRIAVRAAVDDRRLAVGGKPLAPERLHVTLRLMVEYSDVFPLADVECWMTAAASVRMAPFELVFDRVATFGGEGRPLVLKASAPSAVAAVRQLDDAFGTALAGLGKRATPRSFEPHLTVSYHGAPTIETPIEPIRWTAHDFVLIDSHQGEHLHEELGRWSLEL
jgi:2'-5' RNA ligase